MSRNEAETRKLFDAWAETYTEDAFRGVGPLLGYDTSLAIATRLLPIEPGQRVLDIGIGNGEFIGRLVEIVPEIEIAGVDPSARMLQLARDRVPAANLEIGSFTDIPFEDASFDWVISSFAYHEVALDRRGAACAEMQRVLKPNGRIGLLDIMFASQDATDHARHMIGRAWDESENYAIVGELDTNLRNHDLIPKQWHQTGSFHWLMLAAGSSSEPNTG